MVIKGQSYLADGALVRIVGDDATPAEDAADDSADAGDTVTDIAGSADADGEG